MDTNERSTASSDRKKRKKKPTNLVRAAIAAATNPPPAETVATFLILADHADFSTGRNAYVSKPTIAKRLSKSQRMVQSYFKTLREGNWIEPHEPDNLERFMKKFPRADQRPTCYRIVLETLALKPTGRDAPLPVAGPIYWNGERWSVSTGSDGLYVRGAMHRSQPSCTSSSKKFIPSSSPSVPSEQEGDSARRSTTPPAPRVRGERGEREPEQTSAPGMYDEDYVAPAFPDLLPDDRKKIDDVVGLAFKTMGGKPWDLTEAALELHARNLYTLIGSMPIFDGRRSLYEDNTGNLEGPLLVALWAKKQMDIGSPILKIKDLKFLWRPSEYPTYLAQAQAWRPAPIGAVEYEKRDDAKKDAVRRAHLRKVEWPQDFDDMVYNLKIAWGVPRSIADAWLEPREAKRRPIDYTTIDQGGATS